jgi:hypothetical protein
MLSMISDVERKKIWHKLISSLKCETCYHIESYPCLRDVNDFIYTPYKGYHPVLVTPKWNPWRGGLDMFLTFNSFCSKWPKTSPLHQAVDPEFII